MRADQVRWSRESGWSAPREPGLEPGLILLFAAREELEAGGVRALRQLHPRALLLGCSTAGEIDDVQVSEAGMVATLVEFARTPLELRRVDLREFADSRAAGKALGAAMPAEGLRHLFVLSDGLDVNGSDLVAGLAAALPEGVAITGGLSGDGTRFKQTAVCVGDELGPGLVAALGLYGDGLKIGYASLGGWDPFGPERLVTRSRGNRLFELDGHSALGLYKKYLGEHAAGLPSSALLFPLSMRDARSARPPVVRTILGIDEAAESMTFAGDVPEGSYVRLMKANVERLIDGASGAAAAALALGEGPQLALLISCVGRKLVLRQRVEEEVEAVRHVLGAQAALAGFYSYGELCPSAPGSRCELHNQTMTITTFSER